jgi:hypothetical protein
MKLDKHVYIISVPYSEWYLRYHYGRKMLMVYDEKIITPWGELTFSNVDVAMIEYKFGA